MSDLISENAIYSSDENEKITSSFENQIFSNKELQPSKEFVDALNELDYMEKHLDEYKVYNSVEELFEDLDND